MTSLYFKLIKTPNVEPDVVTSAKGPVVSNVVGSVGTSKFFAYETVSVDNPRAEKTLGQSSWNVVVNDTVDKSIHVSLFKILAADPESCVVSDVTTSLVQPNHSIKTTQENFHGESDNESVPIESPEKSQEDVYDKNTQEDVSEAKSIGGEKDDYDDESMSVEGEKDLPDKEDKEESAGVKKHQSTNIVNIDDLDYDDELIGNKLAHALYETIKSCIEKKIRLESMIKSLSEEDADGNLDGDEEEGNKEEGNVATGGDKDEETNGNTDI
ncbi:hypothetical protein KIW84_075402 [Lathyrus oleraceus]|uniref:Uncharacterized protein n=1 Tax=Pisum sativum TaxID=3888 RepID=A0A9D4VTL4_PEA|nr:hypothetical protein KIW84_075402 [Pisum sativum]